MPRKGPAQYMERAIRSYIAACNRADADAIAACFCPEAVHYTSSSSACSGAATIGAVLARMVHADGYVWTVDQVLTDADRCAAALEWTAFRGPEGGVNRGVDWFVFEPHTWRILEVRPYHASPFPVDTARHELLDFDYAGRGYPTTFPPEGTAK